jgi:hypothetical protein
VWDRFTIHYTPTHGSWLNQAEIEIGILVACILVGPTFASQTIEGHAINAATGEGIPGVRVRIFPADSRPANGHSTATDAQGRFRIEGIKEGAYRAMYSAPGFSPVPNPGAAPPAFPVAGGSDPVRLEVKMQPMGKIFGRVLDASQKPVPNAGVWLLREDKWCIPPESHPDHPQSKSDEKGEFQRQRLPPWPMAASGNSTAVLELAAILWR